MNQTLPETVSLGPSVAKIERDGASFAYLIHAINAVGIFANLVVILVFLRHFRPFSAPILTLLALALSDGAFLIATDVLSFVKKSKIVVFPLLQVRHDKCPDVWVLARDVIV